MAELPSPPPGAPWPAIQAPTDGCQRLRPDLRSGLSVEELRALARDLGAQRASAQYLDAMCIVVGNQARAERFGYVLELNVRVPFTSARTMRTIRDQMKAAGLTFGRTVQFGQGRSQVVQCFGRSRPACRDEDGPEELERSYREAEAEVPQATPMRPPIFMTGIPEHVVSFDTALTTQ